MLSMQLIDKLSNGGTVLCLGAHADDIEIGCGGTISALTQISSDISFHWVVFSAIGQRKGEATASAKDLLQDYPSAVIETMDFRNGYFPYIGTEIKDYFETLKALVEPTVVFSHYRRDRHQDHRTISELTWNTFRDHLILEYEVPKYDGDLGSPNTFMTIEKVDLDRKIAVLQTHFTSQHDKLWFTSDTFEALSRLRGIQCNSRSKLAEAFYCEKIILG